MKEYLDLEKKTNFYWRSLDENSDYHFNIIMKHFQITGNIDFLVSMEDYINLLKIFKNYSITSGRTANDQPTFSFAGFSFIMLTNKEIENIKLLI